MPNVLVLIPLDQREKWVRYDLVERLYRIQAKRDDADSKARAEVLLDRMTNPETTRDA